jgi:lipopolysaccharide transport system ATP-binding protein
MSSDEVVIAVRNVSKAYRLFERPRDRIKQFLTLGLRKYHRDFMALRDVSFDVRKGEAVGIIGRNGSGKSTLLQVICGIIKPTTGSVTVNGRISALLELGAGFNPEFTGRENVYFQGALMGFTATQMAARFDDIVAFADIGDFIDQPVRTYSSGMFVRLAFAVAVHVEPDVLVVDEALAVGDAMFRRRCYARIGRMQAQGLTLILVSHDHEVVNNMTRRTLLLAAGDAQFWGETREATHRYRKMLFEDEALRLARDEPGASQPEGSGGRPGEYGIGGARIAALRILGADGRERTTFQAGEALAFEVAVSIEKPLDKLNVSVVIRTLEGVKVYSWGTLNQDIARWADRTPGEAFWDMKFEPGRELTVQMSFEGNLGAGHYEVQAVVSRELDKHYGAQQVLHWRDQAGLFKVDMDPRARFFGGICDLRAKAALRG